MFSKRFLLQESSLRKQHEYFTFNSLIIDKLEDFLIKLIEKLSYSPSLDIDEPKPYSLYSIFIIEIWLNIFVDYFVTICKRCGLSKLKKKKEKMKTSSLMVDLAICKKLVSLVQKMFETYVGTEANRVQFSTGSLITKKNLDSYPSPISSPTNTTLSNDLVTASIVNQETKDLLNSILLTKLNPVSSRLLFNATASLIVPTLNYEQQELGRLEEHVHFNSVILVPFRVLMLHGRLEPHLQDSVITSLSEIVETYSKKVKTAWSSLFACLSRINLNTQKAKKKPKKLRIKSTDSDSSAKSSDSSEIFSSSISSLSSKSSSRSSLSSNSSSNISIRFDSYRTRLSSLNQIFNIYLSLASNSAYVLANGSFDFIKCVSNYLQYSSRIKLKQKDKYSRSDESAKNENNNQEPEDDDLFNDYNLQERHYQITANYEHLCELGNANDSNSFVKPFLEAIIKLVNIIFYQVNI